MSLKEAVEAARQQGNTPLDGRLTSGQMKELTELAAMYKAGELEGINWRILTETMRDRWDQPRLQSETLKRNVRRISHDSTKGSGRSR